MGQDGRPVETHYLIDRRNDYYNVQGLHFPEAAPPPSKNNPAPQIDWASYHDNTLLDGELLWDTYPSGKRRLKYLVFDCLVMGDTVLMNRTLDKRLAYFKDLLLRPYHKLWQEFPEDCSHFIFTVEEKKFEFADGMQLMFEKTIPNLKHGSDGLIFTCRETPYTFGTDENILKWKPSEENTVDFKMEVTFEPTDMETAEGDEVWEYQYDAMPKFTLHVHHGSDDYRPKFEMSVEPSEWEKMKNYAIMHNAGLDGIIVECHKDLSGRWRYSRFRDDKRDGNHFTVVEKVLESIEDAVSKEDLIIASPAVRSGRKEREKRKQEEEQKKRQQQKAAFEEQQMQREQRRKQQEQRQEEAGESAHEDGSEAGAGVRPSSASQGSVRSFPSRDSPASYGHGGDADGDGYE